MPTNRIEPIKVSCLRLDANNPRLGRHFISTNPGQKEILAKMSSWTLDELAISFIENGFWPQEALVVLDDKDGPFTVLEGNRRLAALQLLHQAKDGEPYSPKWKEIAVSATPEKIGKLLSVPCIKVNNRREVQSYLGFRHVTGIKQWAPAEKASYITHLIEEEGLSYEEVMRRIGSKTPTVRRHYIACRLLRQIEEEVEEVSLKDVEERFSVMYLSIRSTGTQKYLGIDLTVQPSEQLRPVPLSHSSKLGYYARWLFGAGEHDPLFGDSRQTDTFGRILNNEKAVEYLERVPKPLFEVAERLAGTEEIDVVGHVDQAAIEVEDALRVAHLYKNSRKLREAVDRFGQGAIRLIELFPDLKDKIINGSA
ncbi:MAG: hypothetical protein OXI44_08015 [Bacteroidota bacterium]|nr:hypothetical protein [Bacteroidota bacterium]